MFANADKSSVYVSDLVRILFDAYLVYVQGANIMLCNVLTNPQASCKQVGMANMCADGDLHVKDINAPAFSSSKF